MNDNLVNDMTYAPVTDAVSWQDPSADDTAMPFVAPSSASYNASVLATVFTQQNLVSGNQPGHLNAQVQDPNLINEPD